MAGTKKGEKKLKSESSKTHPDELTPSELEALAESQAKAATVRLAQARAAAEEAAEKEYQAAAAEAASEKDDDSYTDKRGIEQIFRREMGEPEFWLDKLERVAPKPVLTKDEAEEISRMVTIPQDQTPPYQPQHIISPEFGGLSNYERGITDHKQELEEKLKKLQYDPETNSELINQTQEDLKTLDYLFENYYLGMNVFRTAKGGRAKLRD
jgi:hypothetical protein